MHYAISRRSNPDIEKFDATDMTKMKHHQSDLEIDELLRVKVNNLTIRYGSFTAVKNVSLEIYGGEIFGLLGPNGAGKTSILSVIECLLVPTEGTV